MVGVERLIAAKCLDTWIAAEPLLFLGDTAYPWAHVPIFHRVADLLNLDVEVLFYDTTSLHFEIDQDDEGFAPDDLVHGSSAAGGKAYRAPRKRGLSKDGRGDAPQIVVGMAVTREGFPVRHWVLPGNTVE